MALSEARRKLHWAVWSLSFRLMWALCPDKKALDLVIRSGTDLARRVLSATPAGRAALGEKDSE